MTDLSTSSSPSATAPRPSTRVDKLLAASQRGVGLWIRQSTDQQGIENRGSGDFQLGQLDYLKAYNLDVDDPALFDARGETGRADADRPIFEQLINAVEDGVIAVVIVAWQDRVARNLSDSERLFDALERQNGVVIVGGAIYDPADRGHRMLLQMQAILAAHQNEMRRIRSISTKGTVARSLNLAVNLPTGLVWADPTNPEYRSALEEAGLKDAVSDGALEQHEAVIEEVGHSRYALPYPDADVQRALHLTMRWVLQTRSLREVVDRIENDDAWPRSGCFPVQLSRNFIPQDDRQVKGRLKWKRIINRADGKDEYATDKIREWIRSPALYGTYRFRSPALAELSDREAGEVGARVTQTEAFPGLFPLRYQEKVERIVGDPLSLRSRDEYDGPLNHPIPVVRCDAFQPNGTRCNLKKGPDYRPDRADGRRYRSADCNRRGHLGGVVASPLDELVLDAVEDVYDPEMLRSAIAELTKRQPAIEKRRKKLHSEKKTLKQRMDAAADSIEEARIDGNAEMLETFKARFKRHAKKHRELTEELEELTAKREEITEREAEGIIELGTDVSDLLETAEELEESGAVEGARRRILSVLIDEVRLYELGDHAYRVRIRYPGSGDQDFILFTTEMAIPQPIRAFASEELGTCIEPQERTSPKAEEVANEEAERVAEQINSLIGESDLSYCAGQILAGALHYRYGDGDASRSSPDEHRTLQRLRDELPAKGEALTSAALQGDLGPARIKDGQLAFRPRASEIASACPEAARHRVGAQNGWPVEETVLLSTVKRESGEAWSSVESRAQLGAGVAHDAAGRRYTRADTLPPTGDEEIKEWLTEHHLPEGAHPDDGDWYPQGKVTEEFGCHRATLRNHATVIRPGMGYLGARSVYIWVDDELREKLSGNTPDVVKSTDETG